jgi:hypothetical protein
MLSDAGCSNFNPLRCGKLAKLADDFKLFLRGVVILGTTRARMGTFEPSQASTDISAIFVARNPVDFAPKVDTLMISDSQLSRSNPTLLRYETVLRTIIEK